VKRVDNHKVCDLATEGPMGTNLPGTGRREKIAAREYRQALFKNLHDAVLIHDLSGKVVDVNDKMLEMYRTTREQAIGLSIIPDYSCPGDAELLALQPVLWKEVIAGKGQIFEWKARRPVDGTVFDVEVSLTKLSLTEGDFILATTRDISERKRVERELVATRNYLETVFNSIHDAVFIHDINGKVVDVNDKMLEIYQFSKEEAIGLSVIPDYSVPDDSVDQPERWRKALNGESQFFECRGRRPKDGLEFDVEVFLTRLSLPEGDFILGNTREISERKIIEKQLNAEKQKFQTLSESAPVGMVLIDPADGYRFSYMNPRFRQYFNYRGDIGADIYEWVQRVNRNPSFWERSTARWINIFEGLRPGVGRSHIRKVNPREGTKKHFKFTPVLLGTGVIQMTCWDITRNMELGRKMHERNLILEVLNDVLSSVTGSLHLSEILDTLKAVFATKLKIDAGGVFLWGDSQEKANLQAVWGFPESLAPSFKVFSVVCAESEKGIQETDVTLVSKDLSAVDASILAPFRKYPWRRYLCMSLFVEGERQGTILLVDRREESFAPDQTAIFRALGQQIGVALQNARLFEQVGKSHAQMKALSLRLVEVQEAERRYIARELHDEIGQELTGLKLMLEMNALHSKNDGEKGIPEAQAVVNRLMGLVRELSLNLRPAMLDDLGLLPTLLWHFDRFTNQTAIRVEFKHKGLERKRFTLEIETAIYRIVQEALTNVARHAKVDRVTVRIWSDDSTLGVQVEDDGVGFAVGSATNTGKTNGVDGMRERAILLGGHFAVESTPGQGVRLWAELPIERGIST
jgi:PAS domain S-box-containing protein